MRGRTCLTSLFLTAITLALSAGGGPACSIFDGCDKRQTECDGDTIRTCKPSCEMEGTPDERCSDDLHWESSDCADGRTCLADGAGSVACVPAGTQRCAVETLDPQRDNVLTADVDGDGRADLLVFGSSVVDVHLAGGVVVTTATPEGALENGILVGDVDADGAPDLVFSVGEMPQVARGDGHGAFTFPALGQREIEHRLRPLAVSDMNRDGRADVIVSDVDANVTVLFATDSAGSWNRAPTLNASSALNTVLATADFDEDGLLDLFFADGSVLAGKEDGRFVPLSSIPPTSRSLFFSKGLVVAHDLDGDGHTDLTTELDFRGRVVVTAWFNDGTGHFRRAAECERSPDAPRCVLQPDTGSHFSARDVDGDGKLDLVGTDPYNAGSSPYTMRVRLGNGDGSFREWRSFTIPGSLKSATTYEGKLIVGTYDRGVFVVPRSCF